MSLSTALVEAPLNWIASMISTIESKILFSKVHAPELLVKYY
jgi:hypothetical protein